MSSLWLKNILKKTGSSEINYMCKYDVTVFIDTKLSRIIVNYLEKYTNKEY